MKKNIQIATHSSLSHCKTMVLDISHATLAYTQSSKIFEELNFRGRGQGQGLVVRGRGQGQGLENWSSRIFEDKDFPRGQKHCQ